MKTVLIAVALMAVGCSTVPDVAGPNERELEAIKELEKRKREDRSMIYAEDSGRLQGLCGLYSVYPGSDLKRVVALTCEMAGKKAE